MGRTWLLFLGGIAMAETLCHAQGLAPDPNQLTAGQKSYGASTALSDYGIKFQAGMTSVYQQNMQGGISTHRGTGRFSGRYDIELTADLQKILGVKRSVIFVHTEGQYGPTGGINNAAVGSIFGVNDVPEVDPVPVVLTELYFQRSNADKTFTWRAGKLDMTGGFEAYGRLISFDTNRYANDEVLQFINPALVNNPSIPFPFRTLAVTGTWTPVEWWYGSAGVADAEGTFGEPGFETAFGADPDYFYIFETGVEPKFTSHKGDFKGHYRVGMWVDTTDRQRFSDGATVDSDVGVYLSCDQFLYKENDKKDDTQGLGGFFRYGYAPSNLNKITQFLSLGLQYQGLVEGRDQDVLGVGMAYAGLSDQPNAGFAEDHETAWEFYYRIQATKWLQATPSLQLIQNPGGFEHNGTAVVLGMRLFAVF